MNVIKLTKKLLRFNTINPPGNEAGIAKYIGNILAENGFEIEYPEHCANRLNVIASRGISDLVPPIILTGHLDVVPLGEKDWSYSPFEGDINGDRLYGRGATDMKGGVAAMIIAAIDAFSCSTPIGGIKLIFTADEELGCHGAKKLFASGYDIGQASAIVVGEPTSNKPLIAHKGGLYMKAKTTGVTAHSSMPHLGVNAIYKAAKAIVKIEKIEFDVEKDPILGAPTLNIGKFEGGLNLNSVPDYAEFTIDIRSTTQFKNEDAMNAIQNQIGPDVEIEKIVDLNAISTNENNPFVKMVYSVCGIDPSKDESPKSAPYLTDAAVLTPWLKNAPTVILGPGEPSQAHQTDEFCYVHKLKEVVELYKEIIINNATLHIDEL
ncbi:M20 family metallopeptidase [Muricauda sp. ANG21]|uniref:M20 family metallopeptidase n=1 Tax=Allomuricauda sp. ANG21 TaxID=3042468 RepID=UPI00345615A8